MAFLQLSHLDGKKLRRIAILQLREGPGRYWSQAKLTGAGTRTMSKRETRIDRQYMLTSQFLDLQTLLRTLTIPR